MNVKWKPFIILVIILSVVFVALDNLTPWKCDTGEPSFIPNLYDLRDLAHVWIGGFVILFCTEEK